MVHDFCFLMPYHISENLGGGAEVQAWLLARELARRGYRTAYVAQSVLGKAGTEEQLDGVTLRWIPHARWCSWAVSSHYYAALNDMGPAVVVQRMASFETGVAGIYCRRRSSSFVWICTSDTVPQRWYFLKRQAALSRRAGQRWPKRLFFFGNAFITDIARQYGMSRVSLAFTQNETQREALLSSFGIPSCRMVSGHEPPAKVQEPAGRLSERIALWVGNLGSNKRPEKFIELARNLSGSGWRFVMIGSHADQSYLSSLFRETPENLTWLGRLPFGETLRWFDRASWFVNTSLAEGFPNTYVQAWLRGVPVLALCIDPDGVVTQRGLGAVCGAVGSLGQQLELLSDPETYSRISNRVRSYALQHHTVSAMADGFLDALRTNGVAPDSEAKFSCRDEAESEG